MKYCLAYGRNLDLERMKEKCPHSILVGKSMLKDYQISFKKYITIEPHIGGEVPVGIWGIDADGAEKELDIIEGFPEMYRKEYVELEFDGRTIESLVYLINDTNVKVPDEQYFGRLLKGYADFGFDRRYLDDAVQRAKEEVNSKNIQILN